MAIIGMLEAVRGCLKEEVNMDVIANNLANTAVVGFKRDRVSFQEILAGTEKALVHVETDLGQGELRFTGNQLDLAINGPGFFKVNTPEGVRYTRKGNFTLDATGTLITTEGYQVLGKGGPISIPAGPVTIDQTGRVVVGETGVDQLDVVTFEDPKRLVKVGGTMFKKPDGVNEGPVGAETVVKQGYLEESNVNVAEEMVRMVHSLRAFESYQRAVKVLDHLDDKATNDVARLR